MNSREYTQKKLKQINRLDNNEANAHTHQQQQQLADTNKNIASKIVSGEISFKFDLFGV